MNTFDTDIRHEVRLGNWLYVTYNGEKRVQQIWSAFMLHLISNERELAIINGKEYKYTFEPIALTPDLVEKAGFRLFNGEYVKRDISLKWYEEYGFFVLDHYSTEIKYLHELQNVFYALNKVELKVKL